jgi:aspartyl-tRNA(Asn)/glutamyl-tRNA(Gln) amidotransferase subunit A
VPIALKDSIDLASVATTVGCPAFKDRMPDGDAAAVALLRQAGCIFLGKTNMNELASGLSGRNATYGHVPNPWCPQRAAGGSSSGTGAAVSAHLAMAGMGTDSGGSLRVPAAWLNVVGVRPGRGRVDHAGIYPRAQTLDAAGPMTRTVVDAAWMMDALVPAAARPAGDAQDRSFASDIGRGIEDLRIGVAEWEHPPPVEAPVAEALAAACAVFRSLGARVVRCPAPIAWTADLQAAHLRLLSFEFARTIEATFGRRSRFDLLESFGGTVRRDLEAGFAVSEDDYAEARAALLAHERRIDELCAGVDALISPVTPMLPPPLDAPDADFARCRVFTLPFSSAGVPSMSLPCGFSEGGLPIGLQLVCGKGRERTMFRIAAAFEGATQFHHRSPFEA